MSVLGTLSRPVRRLSPSLDTRVSWLRYRRHDPSLRLIDGLVHRGDLVLDIGAAEGFYAARFSQLVGRRGRVLAFEPNPEQFARLEAVSARRRNVTAHHMALSDHAGDAQLHVPVLDSEQRLGLGSLAVPAGRADIEHRVVSIRVDRLDAVLSGELPPLAFVKCDVEGHEFAVLRGAEETLRRSHPAIFVEIEQRHQDAPIQRTFDYLHGLGYVGQSVHDGQLAPLEEFSVERDQLAFLGPSFREILPPGYVHNFLFAPKP